MISSHLQLEISIPRIVPSQVVAFIKSSFPEATERAGEDGNFFSNLPDQGAKLRALLRMIEAIPVHLWPIDNHDYEDVLFATAAIDYQLRRWEAGDVRTALGLCDGKSRHPVTLLYNAFGKCKDEAPAPTTSELMFIDDPSLRESIRLDVSGAVSALSNNEFKAATVLAGAAIEAMLLWAIQRHNQIEVERARSELASKGVGGCSKRDPQEWHLPGYIAVAELLGLLSAGTAKNAATTKDFRNLIHPGKAQRENQQVSIGYARVAVGTIDIVAIDLERAITNQKCAAGTN